MNQADKNSLLSDIDAGLTLLTSTKRPNDKTIARAVTVFQGVKVACQTIAVSPTEDNTAPPDPGPEQPPIDPAPPEIPPGTGGGGGSNQPPPVTTVTTTYTSNGDFTGTQGFRGWYYMEEDETLMTYSAGTQVWSGSETYQSIWSTGQHPGSTDGAMRRWVAQNSGTFSITGSASDADLGSPGNNVTVTIKKNGTTIYGPTTITSGSTAVTTISGVTGSCATLDEFDFIVKGVGGISFASTNLQVSIALTTTTTGTGSGTQTTLPFNLNGTAPQEGVYTINANKPSNADGCTIAITGVNLAAAYGRLYFNGNVNSLALWATAPANVGISATVTLTVPVAYMINGANTLRFTHDSGTGYTVTAVATPIFTAPATPTPPATQTSLPFILNGSILPEDGLLSLNLSKPSNANGCTMTVTGNDLDSVDGTLTVNGSSNSMSIFPVNSANNGVSRTVTLNPNVNWFVNGNNALRFTHSTGDGFTVTNVNVTFSTPPVTDPTPPVGTGAFPNMPSGMTIVLDEPFSNTLKPGWENVFTTQAYAQFSTAPITPPACFDSFVGVGSFHGNGQWVWNMPRPSEVFVGLYWATNSDFMGYSNSNNKFFFVKSQDFSADNSFMVFQGAQGSSHKTLKWYQQAQVNNTHVPNSFGMNWPVDGTGWFEPNINASVASIGVGSGFHRVELYMKKSASATSQDGIIKIWVDGVLSTHVTTANLQYNGFENFQINHAWDGGDRGDESKAWHHYFDHLLIATR